MVRGFGALQQDRDTLIVVTLDHVRVLRPEALLSQSSRQLLQRASSRLYSLRAAWLYYEPQPRDSLLECYHVLKIVAYKVHSSD